MKSMYYYFENQKWSRWLLVALLFLLPFELIPRFEFFGATVRLSQLVAVGLIAINISQLWQTKKKWLQTPWVWLTAFVAIAVFSSVFAISRTKAVMTTMFYTFDFVLAFAVALVFSLKQSEIYKKVIIGVSLLVVLFCLFQFFGDMWGLASSQTMLSEKYSKLIFGFARVRGFSIEPLYLANYLLIPLSVSLAGIIIKKPKLYYVFCAIFLSVIWLTVARGAYLATAIILLLSVVILMLRNKIKNALLLICVIFISIIISFGLIWISGKYSKQLDNNLVHQTEFDTTIPTEGISAEGNADRLIEHTTDFTSETSFTDRLKTGKTALQLARSHPLLGVGPGNFGRYVVKAYPQTFSDINQISNNETLEILSELGGLGLIAIFGFATCLFIYGINYKFKDNDKENNFWFLATSFMLLGFVIQWQTFSTLYVTHIWVVVGMYLATTKNLRKIKTPNHL